MHDDNNSEKASDLWSLFKHTLYRCLPVLLSASCLFRSEELERILAEKGRKKLRGRGDKVFG